MRDLIDSILIGGMATYLPFWTWDNSRDQIMEDILSIEEEPWQEDRCEEQQKPV